MFSPRTQNTILLVLLHLRLHRCQHFLHPLQLRFFLLQYPVLLAHGFLLRNPKHKKTITVEVSDNPRRYYVLRFGGGAPFANLSDL